jgi:hypothetical protein
MKPFIVFKENGQILRSGNCSDDDFIHQALDGEFLIEGIANPVTQYISNGDVIDMPIKPDSNHVFDYSKKEWIADIGKAASVAIEKRNQLLAAGPDRVNPLWWASMSADEQAEVAQYRQALLDITNQFGYPLDIEWPPLPSVFERS